MTEVEKSWTAKVKRSWGNGCKAPRFEALKCSQLPVALVETPTPITTHGPARLVATKTRNKASLTWDLAVRMGEMRDENLFLMLVIKKTQIIERTRIRTCWTFSSSNFATCFQACTTGNQQIFQLQLLSPTCTASNNLTRASCASCCSPEIDEMPHSWRVTRIVKRLYMACRFSGRISG